MDSVTYSPADAGAGGGKVVRINLCSSLLNFPFFKILGNETDVFSPTR